MDRERGDRLMQEIEWETTREAPPLKDTLWPVPEELEQFGPDALRLLDRHNIDVECNWKLVADAFIEVYHLRVLHPGTINTLLDPKRTTIGLLPNGHSRMVTGIRPKSVGKGFAVEAFDFVLSEDLGNLNSMQRSVEGR